ncbi:ethanolamine ammonia-lyase subunit EutC [Cobetia amphilecti]|uniref:Ethanolamine ammonia-lyase small subunit n=1 Tax=Cobetia amphilecti TaxID=1055104 RepID=A0ABT6UPZ2_9GAMM|nr:ethanolamine ammonia-lyase subunit EutC [Cobetia amphilecti]MDI5884481.1 ethanolamine ammonia-lyase subunit EutC [Cobetia amphilecti]
MNPDQPSADAVSRSLEPDAIVTPNPWQRLGQFTDARIGLGRAGISLPTNRSLEFQLAHARAQDAVHLPLEIPRLIEDLNQLTALENAPQIQRLHSRAMDRTTYLQRPDYGRRLDEDSRQQLSALDAQPADLAIVVVDGLSSLAVQNNAAPFIASLLESLAEDGPDAWSLAPISVVEQGRVAIGDEVGELLKARAVLVMVGERPGLSSPDSLGLYLTWQPRVGLSDASRNCISNVRPAGLDFAMAAQRLHYLLREARKLGLTGVGLKDRSGETALEGGAGIQNFLLS